MQPAHVDTLRRLGWAMFPTFRVGEGFPDYVGAIAGVNVLIEFKTGEAGFTDDEVTFHASWPGPLEVVRTTDDCLALDAKYRRLSRDMREAGLA